MVVWGVFAVLTAAVAFAVLRPYWLHQAGEDTRPLDVEIYKLQLAEIDDDCARGVIAEQEAEAARIEISRRLLAAASAGNQPPPITGLSTQLGHGVFAALAIVMLVGITAGVYFVFGSPGQPGQPLATRQKAQQSRVASMIERAEARLREHPEEGVGWEAIGPVYMRMGRFHDAVTAYTNALKTLGESGDRLANLGEALAFANNGEVSPEARTAFQKATEIDTAHPKAAFWLGVADEQSGRLPEAIERFKKLLDSELPDDAKAFMRARVEKLTAQLATAQQQRPQPALDQPAQASAPQSGADHAQIDGMVTRLAERLKKDGSDLDGWMKLVKSYSALGRRDDALSALKDARIQFNGNADALGQIDALARSLGLAS